MAVYADFSGEVSIIKHRVFTMERQALLRAAVAYTMETPHEIEVPCSAAELAIGDYMVSGSLLLSDQFSDCLILHRLQLIGSNLAALKIRPSLLQLGRAKKAANIVIAKRGISFAHSEMLLPHLKDMLIKWLKL